MDSRELAAMPRRLRREYARRHRQEARRWPTPRQLRRRLADRRDRRQVEFYSSVRPGMVAIPPDDPMQADMFRRMGRPPQYVPVRRRVRVLLAVMRVLGQQGPRPVRVPDPSSGDDGTAGVREPRRPLPSGPHAGAAPLPPDDENAR